VQLTLGAQAVVASFIMHIVIDILQTGLMFCHILDESIDSSYNRRTFNYNRYYPTQSIHPCLHSLLRGQWPSELEHESFINKPAFLCI
jgi:hypothetical protein